MKTTRTDESPSKVRLAIEATADEVEPAVDRAVRELANEVKIPGFRQGKAPRKVLEARLGREAIREAAIRAAIPQFVAAAVKDEDLAPVATPSVEITSYDVGGPMALDVTVEIRPVFDLPDLETFVATRPSVRATDEEVEEQLKRLRDRFASLETVGRKAKRGDYVLMDLRAYYNEQTIEQASGTDLLYEVGSEGFVPALDQELDGSGAGEILRFNAVLPEEAGGEFAGKEVSFQVLIKEARQKVLPDLGDEFAKTASEFETLDELREDLRKRISQVKRLQGDAEVRNRLLEQLVEATVLDPPESLVRDEMAYRLQRFADDLRRAGITVDEYLQQTGQTEEQIEADLRRQAESSVRARLILEEIGRREGLGVTGEEVTDEVRRHAETMGHEPAELQEQLSQSGRLGVLAGDIIRRKALDFVVERAEIRSEDPEEPEAASDSSPEKES